MGILQIAGKIMDESVEAALFIIVFFIIAINLIIAHFFAEIAEMKGYERRKYFLLSFFFGLAGWLMVVALPYGPAEEKSRHYEDGFSKKDNKKKGLREISEDENDKALNEFISKLEKK